MESVECGDLGFENWDGDLPDCSSSGVLTHRPNETTELSCKPVNGSAGPFNALEENSGSRDFASNDDKYTGINRIHHLIGCQLDNALAQQLTRTTRAGTGSFSQNQMDRFMSSGGQLKDGFPESHVQSNNASSSNGKKRKKMFDDKYQLAQLKYHQRGEIDGEGCAEKQKQEQHLVSNMGCKLEGKTVDEFSNCKKDLKEDSIHVKAKRRQSLNNHSRAERIRREKISERMKFLQDIVPGCSKIIGKSAMLDEIINYVLSLQQQIEFLSMKVATVYPEINLGIQQIPSRDANNNEINCSQDGNTTMLGGPRIDTYYTIQDEVSYRTFSANRNTNHLERAHTSGKHVEQRCPK